MMMTVKKKPPNDAPSTAPSNPVLAGLKITQPLLVRLHEQHRKSRRRRDGQRAVLRNCDLSRLDLRAMVFDDAEFVGCDFRQSRITT